ncbi:hypothetical protein K6Y31_20640 [Motilimonas cestriensis]|uniref:Uncharacterized protein n=1 Tax=Motilimonas cestriensis TaxID=2742685 RepID=A0ABS8WIK3_9GAMM|nr:hypothetical protein [Motilimonas cestriensis]MCE2597185.1 hypothetical protein [Motilimonas cestriensis]
MQSNQQVSQENKVFVITETSKNTNGNLDTRITKVCASHSLAQGYLNDIKARYKSGAENFKNWRAKASTDALELSVLEGSFYEFKTRFEIHAESVFGG